MTDHGEVPAVNRVDLYMKKGEVLGIVGESGCGKSVTSLSIMRLIASPQGRIEEGSILFKGEDLVGVSEKRLRRMRGNEMAMIFQEPMTSLNPVYTIGNQMGETVRLHRKLSKKDALNHSIEMLKKVGIPRPEQIVREYPHHLSGGMRQRVMIAMAISCEPELLIADEPTTALDVTIQAQILDLMRKLNKDSGTTILMITHDLGVVAEMCDRVVVMYAGRVVEEGEVQRIFKNPQHPYTMGLIQSVPHLKEKRNRLYSIPGSVPNPVNLPIGCSFAPRCEYVMGPCLEEMPELVEVANGHRSRCWLNKI
ncbi:MAG TPA: ABC transporter ATP-binding protein [Bacillota bacterium]|nr:ABC transporter ATP-binding protein [Bacillota bacterium]